MAGTYVQIGDTVKELALTGYNVKYIESVNIVKVTIEGVAWYVSNVEGRVLSSPPIKNETNVSSDDFANIRLYYEGDVRFTVYIKRDEVKIFGKHFTLIGDNKYIGYLRDNVYVELTNKWVNDGIIRMIIEYEEDEQEEVRPFEIEKSVLDLDFTPILPREIDIQNVGHKLIIFNHIIKSNIDAFTAFLVLGEYISETGIDYIAEGKYTYSDRNDLFRFVSKSGELFATLTDPQTNRTYLANAAKNIELTSAKSCLVQKIDGLFNGYKLINESYHESTVYCYNYIYFAIYPYCASFQLLEQQVKKPNSGMHTKAAAATPDIE